MEEAGAVVLPLSEVVEPVLLEEERLLLDDVLLLLLLDELLLLLLLCPIEVSLDGTAVAPAGMEFSYSLLSRSIALRMLELKVISSVSAKVWRSFLMSGIQ